jgi:phosphatidylglycerophosphate synthase
MSARTVWDHFFGRRTRKADETLREQILTGANVLTAARAIISTTVLIIAVINHSHALLLFGLAFSMFFDFVDGQIARAREGETILGAQLDGIADRIAAALVAVGVVALNGDARSVVAATVVWIQFGVVDQLLTSQFLRFGLWSPDHFFQLDPPWGEKVWRWNWSAGAKMASNLPIALLALELWWLAAATAFILVVLRLPGYLAIQALARRIPPATVPLSQAEAPGAGAHAARGRLRGQYSHRRQGINP